MKNVFVFLLSLISFASFSQLSSYKFENTLKDEIGSYDAIHTTNGQINNQSEFINEGNINNYALKLSQIEGIYLPKSINSKIDFSKSIEIVLDFKITDLGNSRGTKRIIELSKGWNDNTEGINVHTDKVGENNFNVIFNYTDGGYNRGVAGHPGGSRNLIGSFKVNEWINFKLIIDFENKIWRTYLNNELKSGFFDKFYDFDLIKKTVFENYIRFGWLNSGDLAGGANVKEPGFTSTIVIDNLKIYSPMNISLISELKNGLNEMTNHVKGLKTLSSIQLGKLFNDIKLNYGGNFTNARSEIFNFINAFESKNDPLFTNNSLINFSNLPIESQTLIFLQQSIFDFEYNSEEKIINMSGVKFEAANHFPGIVKQSAPRETNSKVEINGNYNIVFGARHLNDRTPVKRPTGYYLAPGEIATIRIPENLIDKNLKVMIGVHERDHSSLNATNRFVRISKEFNLDKIANKVANPFGGGIYILVPEGANLGNFNIIIDGAVKSPYFSSRRGKETNLNDWKFDLERQNTPWSDIEGDKFMTTIESSRLYGTGSINLIDPTLLMKKWEEVADAFNYVGGRPLERSRAEYIISDSRLPDDGYGTGYPAVYDRFDNNMSPLVLLKNEPFKLNGVFTLFHEMGHLEWHPTLGKSIESIVHLPAVYLWNNYYKINLDDSFKYSAFQKLSMDQAKIDWMISDNFRNNKSMECDPTMQADICDEVRYQHRGHAMYVEIVDLFGWEAIYNMHNLFFKKWKENKSLEWGFMRYGNGNYIKDDELILAASESLGVNMIPLFHYWGLHPSTSLVNQLKNFPKSDKVFCKLLEYKKLIPSNTKEFKVWFDLFLGTDNIQQVRYDYALLNYEGNDYAKKMQSQIDLLLNTYYGQNYTSKCDLSQKDTDKDGITDDMDKCPNTPLKESVNIEGCAKSQLDSDKDGISDDLDKCPNSSPGAKVDSKGCELILANSLSDKKVIISPNPFEQSIKIEFPKDFGPLVSAKIYDVKGVVVWEKESVKDSEIVDLSDLSVGNYVLNLTSKTNDQVCTIKLIKQVR